MPNGAAVAARRGGTTATAGAGGSGDGFVGPGRAAQAPIIVAMQTRDATAIGRAILFPWSWLRDPAYLLTP